MKYLIWLLTFLTVPGVALAAEGREAAPAAKVVVATVQEKMVAENTPIVGTVYFDRVSRVSTEVSGLVQSIPFRTGDRIKKGEILVGLNTDFIEKNIDLALTRLEQVDVQIEKLGRDLERYEALYREKAATEKAYDDLRFSRRELLKQREALGKELEIARLKKDKGTIRAPFDGIVLEKRAEVGDWVGPGAVFCRLGSLDDVCVKVPIAEELMRYSRKGTKIRVTFPAFQKSVSGMVAGFLPVADLKTKNVMIKIKLPRIPQAVENLSASVLVPTGRPKKLALVPRDALINLQGRTVVYTVKEGRAVSEPVTVSAFVGKYAGVDSSMVTAGMSVIVDGGERLRPDQPVEVVKGLE